MALLDAVTEAVSGLGQTLWAARSAGELLATMTGCERLRSVLDAVELGLVAEIDATGAARHDGWASTKDYVGAVTGGFKGAGRRLLALARSVASDRAATGEALASGSISRVQAEVVVAAVEALPVRPGLRAAAEELLLAEARELDATDLTGLGRVVLARLDPRGADRRDEAALAREERAAHHGRFLSISEDGIGGVRLKGRGSVEDAAHLTTVLFSLAAPQPPDRQPAEPGGCGGDPARPAVACGVVDCAHDGRDPREHGTRMWDALVEAVTLREGVDLLPESHGAKPRVALTLAYEDLAGALTPGHRACPDARATSGVLDTGGTLSAATARRLACDAEVLPVVLGSRSQILDVGRASRLVTSALWAVLVARDRHCAFPGCSRPPVACDAHHLQHWADGGATALHNLVLCRTHHTMLHTTPWEVRLDLHDRRPTFLPPSRPDPDRRPRRRLPLRR